MSGTEYEDGGKDSYQAQNDQALETAAVGTETERSAVRWVEPDELGPASTGVVIRRRRR